MNSKQIVAAASAVVLFIILIYPTFSNGTVSVSVQSSKIDNAEHVYVTVIGIWAHQKGQPSTGGWKQIYNKSQSIDLVPLANSTQLLGSGQISVANYDSIRLDITNTTWVFNKTSTKLLTTSPSLITSLEFTLGAGKNVSIKLLVSGRQQTVGKDKFFAANLNATLTAAP